MRGGFSSLMQKWLLRFALHVRSDPPKRPPAFPANVRRAYRVPRVRGSRPPGRRAACPHVPGFVYAAPFGFFSFLLTY